MKTALITGASQGIGAAIAYELNNNKIKVILVSRSKKKLKGLNWFVVNNTKLKQLRHF